MLLFNDGKMSQYKLGIVRIKVFMKFLFQLSLSKYRIRSKRSKPSKIVRDNDKGNILNFNASLALASPHCKINWMTCSNVVLPSSPINLENSGTL
jgi:hypothetical protein